jgi:hypothetical protein
MPINPPTTNPLYLDVAALRPDRGQMQQRAAAIDEQSRLQRIDAVQPDRRCGQSEGKAGAAGGNGADQRSEPKQRDRIEWISGNHRFSRD